MSSEAGAPPPAPEVAGRWSRIERLSSRSWAALKDYVARVYEKADEDNIFLMASALTFSAVVAAVPFLLIIVGLISLTLEAAADAAGIEPVEQLRRYLNVIVPVLREAGLEAPDDQNLREEVFQRVIERGQTIGLISFVAFVWFSTRLFGALRTVLREIFDLRQARGIVQGKLFDAEMVLVSSVLMILNIGITIAFEIARRAGFEFLGLSARQIGLLEDLSARLTALVFIFLLFLLIYKYLPARRVPWRVAVTAAVFTALCWELLKQGFAFYLTNIADYRSIYGGIATLVVVVIWLYYLSIAFILGAEVAQVRELRRARRRQIEVLE